MEKLSYYKDTARVIRAFWLHNMGMNKKPDEAEILPVINAFFSRHPGLPNIHGVGELSLTCQLLSVYAYCEAINDFDAFLVGVADKEEQKIQFYTPYRFLNAVEKELYKEKSNA